MASVNFTSGTVIPNAWAVDVNSLVWGVFNGATTVLAARTALGATLGVWPLSLGGTGQTTASTALTALGGAARGINTDITSLSAPALGAATATTASALDSSTLVATTAFVNYRQGSFTATLTGCTATVTGTANYSLSNGVVTLDLPSLSGTSNTTAATITGLPAAIQPTSTKSFICNTVDNTTATVSVMQLTGGGGTITLFHGTTGSPTFTNTGTKGLNIGGSFSYTLT